MVKVLSIPENLYTRIQKLKNNDLLHVFKSGIEICEMKEGNERLRKMIEDHKEEVQSR